MTKVGIILFAAKDNGGVYQYTQSLINTVKNDKTRKYVLFCLSHNHSYSVYDLESRVVHKHSTNFFIKGITALQLLFFIRSPLFYTKQEKNIFSDIDIWLSPIICTYPHFFLRKPYIFTLHDMQERYYPDFFSRKERFFRWLNNRALTHFAKKIICESNFVKNDIIKFENIVFDKVAVIPSPPLTELSNFTYNQKQTDLIKEKYSLPDKYLYYPSQFWPHKNHIQLLKAFKLINQDYPDVFLVFSGAPQNYYDEVLKEIKYSGLEEKIKCLGYIDYFDMQYVYKLSYMLVVPTLFESVSIPIYEAFNLGVPVCCSNVVALPEQIDDAGLLFDPHDYKDIADKISLYLSNEKIRQEKITLGYNRIKGFNYCSYQEKLNNLLSEIGY
jgi:glycosyltransferase involved in cell wall biosynthesis